MKIVLQRLEEYNRLRCFLIIEETGGKDGLYVRISGMRLDVFFLFRLKCDVTGNISSAFYLSGKKVTVIASFEEIRS